MKRFFSIFFLCLIMIGLLFSNSLITHAASPQKRDLMITSLENTNTVYAGKQATYSVAVSSMDSNNPEKTMKPYNDGNVTVYFKNTNNDLIESKPISKGDGTYLGKVTLPDTGDWDVLVIALRKGEKEAADQSNVYTMTTQWAVHPPQGHGTAWLIGVVCVMLLILVYFVIRRVRRLNHKK